MGPFPDPLLQADPSACPGRRSKSCIAQVTHKPVEQIEARFQAGLGKHICQLTHPQLTMEY